MSKRRTRIDSAQLNLLEYLENVRCEKQAAGSSREGSLNVRYTLRAALNQAIKECKLSRHQIAGEMSHLLGIEITKTTLDSWTAESKPQNRMPAEYLPAFCRATGSTGPIDVLNEAAGIFGLPGPDALRAEIQKWAEQERQARAEKRRRELFLDEMERRRK